MNFSIVIAIALWCGQHNATYSNAVDKCREQIYTCITNAITPNHEAQCFLKVKLGDK